MEDVAGLDARLAALMARGESEADGGAFWDARPVAVRLAVSMPIAAAATLRGGLAKAAVRVATAGGERRAMLEGDAEQ